MEINVTVVKSENKLVGFCGHCGGPIREKNWQAGRVGEAVVKLHFRCYHKLGRPEIVTSAHNRTVEIDFQRVDPSILVYIAEGTAA